MNRKRKLVPRSRASGMRKRESPRVGNTGALTAKILLGVYYVHGVYCRPLHFHD
jgi:hypothetical protein